LLPYRSHFAPEKLAVELQILKIKLASEANDDKEHTVLISGLVITHQLTAEAVPWLAKAARVFDELLVFVDEERAMGDVHARARDVGATVFSSHAKTFYESDFGHMVATCAGDWVVRLDADEELSPEWHDPSWRSIFSTADVSHFWCPRRWLTSPGFYLAEEPWWPDYQLRVFRNRPSEIAFPTRSHEVMAIRGKAGYFRSLSIHHHDLWMSCRHVRDAKAERYKRDRSDRDLSCFYCFEDFAIEPISLPVGSVFNPETELLHMREFPASQVCRIRLVADTLPRELTLRQPRWLKLNITNGSTETLRSGGPFPMYLSYHWLDPDRRAVLYEGYRTAIIPGIAPGESASINAFIFAPNKAGQYLLQVSVVQENVRWLEDADPSIAQEFSVTVT
jgi:hypothetical protein